MGRKKTINTLHDKEKLFIQNYMESKNGADAAIRAGYSRKSAARQAYVLKQRPNVMAAIEQLSNARIDAMSMVKEGNDIRKDEIIKGLFEIATNPTNSATSRVSAYSTLAKYTIETKGNESSKLNFTLNIGDTNLLQVADEAKSIDTKAYDVEGDIVELSEDTNE